MDSLFTAFVSSTYEDLVSERQLISRTLLDHSCVPLGMEFFPASGATPWTVITKTIDRADFAVLIVAGRYGSLTDEGISWIEREYEELRHSNKQIVALLHRDWTDLPRRLCESDPAMVNLLEAFRARVRSDQTVRYWNDDTSLMSGLSASLQNLVHSGELGGWSRHPKTSSGLPIDFASLSRSGLLGLQLDFYKSIDWSGLMRDAREVDLFFTYARSWRRQLTRELDAVSRSARVRVLLPDPDAPTASALEEIAKRAGEDLGTVRQYIREAAAYYHTLGAEVFRSDQSQLFASYRFDDVVVASMYNHRRGLAPTLPVLMCERGGELFDFFRDDFQFIIDNHAQPWPR